MATQFEDRLMTAVLEAIRRNYRIVTNAPYGAVITDSTTKQSSYFINEGGDWKVVGEVPDVGQFEYTCRQFGVVFSTMTVSAADPDSANSLSELYRNGGVMQVKLPMSEVEADIPKVVMAVLSNKTPAPSPAAAPSHGA